MTHQLWPRETTTVCKRELTARQKSRNSLNETSITASWRTSRYKLPSTTNTATFPPRGAYRFLGRKWGHRDVRKGKSNRDYILIWWPQGWYTLEDITKRGHVAAIVLFVRQHIARNSGLYILDVYLFISFLGEWMSTNYVVVVGISTSCIIKMGQNDLNSQCRIVCAALSICPHYEKEWTSISFMCSSICVLCVQNV